MENLKKLRNSKNLSQAKLADILGISQQSIYKYENKIAFPDIETLKSMADFFQTSIDYIVGYTNIPHKIESLSEPMLNYDELNHINKYRRLSKYHKTIIDAVMDSYLYPDQNHE